MEQKFNASLFLPSESKLLMVFYVYWNGEKNSVITATVQVLQVVLIMLYYKT